MKLAELPKASGQDLQLPEGHIGKPPLLGAFIGSRGSGKTTTCFRYVLACMRAGIFNRVYLISPTAPSQTELLHYLQIDPKDVWVSTNATKIKEAIDTAISRIKAAREQYDEDQEYRKAYELLSSDRGHRLTPIQAQLLDNMEGRPPSSAVQPFPRGVILLDDLSHCRALSSNFMSSKCLTHRHLAGGQGALSIIFLQQTVKGCISKAIRSNLSLIVIWRTHSETCLKELFEECCGGRIGKKRFLEIFQDATQGPHDSLWIDLSQTDVNRTFSKNAGEEFYKIRG